MSSYLENPVFICGHRKSGTTMLINLLDGLNDAVTYPDDSGFFYMYYPKFSGELDGNAKVQRVANRIIATNLQEVIDRTKCSSEIKEKLTKNNQLYYKNMMEFQGDDYSEYAILKHFISSFQSSFLPKIQNPKVWIEKTTSTEIYAQEIAQWFPNAKFIHMVRDPRDNWSSLQSGWEKRYKNFNDSINTLKHSMIERGHLGLKLAIENEKVLGKDRYYLIKYEDFTQNSEKYMKEMADFMGIEYSEKLLQPTTFGQTWEGNNFDGIKNTKPSSINVNRWKERISNEDAALMEFYFEDVMHHFGYKLEFSVEQRVSAATNHYKWYNFHNIDDI
ncbi:MAG: sulfotransferase family protein [Campylobacterota bacterium]